MKKRILSLLLVVVMMFTVMPMTTNAKEKSTSTETVDVICGDWWSAWTPSYKLDYLLEFEIEHTGEMLENWDSITAVFTNAQTTGATAPADEVEGYKEYAVVRADMYSWGGGENLTLDGNYISKEMTLDTWDEFCAIMTDAHISATFRRIDNKIVMIYHAVGANGDEFTYRVSFEQSADDDVYVFFTGENCNLSVTLVNQDDDDSDNCGDNVTWSLVDGVLTISGEGEMEDYSETVVAPWYDERDEIVAVVVESGVTYIGDNAFSDCDNLTEITIADSVTEYGDFSFAYCDALASVSLPAIQMMGYNPFAYCSNLTEITIAPSDGVAVDANGFLHNPADWTLIAYPAGKAGFVEVPINERCYSYAFAGCNITSVYIPYLAGTFNILFGSNIFDACNSLTDIYYMGTMTDWEEIDFLTDNLSEVTVHYECEIIVDEAVAPTCAETGLTEGSHCSCCGKIIIAQEEIPALGHDYVNSVCSLCGEDELTITYADLNGDEEIAAVDAAMAYSIVNGKLDASDAQLLAADVNGDGEVTAVDAAMIYSYVNGKISAFPAE